MSRLKSDDLGRGAPFVRHGTTYYLSDEEYDELLRHDGMAVVIPVRTPISPTVEGQARYWLADVFGNIKPTPFRAADRVAAALAVMADGDSIVRTTRRRLAEGVGSPRWFTDDGVRSLVAAGWLRVVTVGRGRGARTTFCLMPGDVAPSVARSEQAAA